MQTRQMNRTPLHHFLKVVNGGSAALLVISGAALGIMVLLVSYDVIMRSLFGIAVTGVAEYVAEWLMPATVLFALAYTERKHEHIRVTIVEDYIKHNPQKVLRVLSQAITVAIAGVLTWSSYNLATDAFAIRETVPMGTDLLAVWPIKMVVFVGWVWLTVQALANLVALLVAGAPVPVAQTPVSQTSGAPVEPEISNDSLIEQGNRGGSRD